MLVSSLESITIKGFKSIASANVELKPINIVIGANGSGKSNLIGVFDFLHEISEGRLRDYVVVAGGADKVVHFGSKTTDKIELRLFFDREQDGWSGLRRPAYELTLSPTGDDGLFPSHEAAYFRHFERWVPEDLNSWQQGREAGISNPDDPSTRAIWQREYLKECRPYHLLHTGPTSPMRKTARVDDNHYLYPDGSNLPAFLYYLREMHRDSYRMIVRAVQQVAPFFDDFQLEPLQLKPDSIKLEWRHKGSHQSFPASALSDGTLRFIVLATIFLRPPGPHRPPLIIVDEPELSLHPFAIGILAALIRQASVSTQVIVATQSAQLLDHFEPEDVLVADRAGNGTQLRRLDSKQLERWLEAYSLGQLWEKNEIGGRPVPA